MQRWTRRAFGIAAAAITSLSLLGCAGPGASPVAGDPLPSWNEGAARQAIVKFVGDVTREGGPAYVAPANGWIAVSMKRDWKTIFPPPN